MSKDYLFVSNDELKQLGHTKERLTWTIAGQQYILVRATPEGYYFNPVTLTTPLSS